MDGRLVEKAEVTAADVEDATTGNATVGVTVGVVLYNDDNVVCELDAENDPKIEPTDSESIATLELEEDEDGDDDDVIVARLEKIPIGRAGVRESESAE
jgi:hypothetical protein